MPEGKLVRVSPDTMKKLAKVRNGFESPNDCMNRLLSKSPCKSETTEQTEDGPDSNESESQKSNTELVE